MGRYRCCIGIPSKGKYTNLAITVNWASRFDTNEKRIIENACKQGVQKILGNLYSIYIKTWSPTGIVGTLIKRHPTRGFIPGSKSTVVQEDFQVGFYTYWNAFPTYTQV